MKYFNMTKKLELTVKACNVIQDDDCLYVFYKDDIDLNIAFKYLIDLWELEDDEMKFLHGYEFPEFVFEYKFCGQIYSAIFLRFDSQFKELQKARFYFEHLRFGKENN